MPEKRFNVTAGADHIKNQHVLTLNAIDDDILARKKTSQARAQILIAAASDVGITGKKGKPIGDGINHTVGNLEVAALGGEVVPDAIKFGFRLRCNTVRISGKGVALPSGEHVRAASLLARGRARTVA
jgi:hypothetical protein